MQSVRMYSLVLAIGAFLCVATVWAADQKVTLMLGGKFCEFYTEAIETALKQVSGVTGVDLKSKKGHAVVEVEAGKVKPDQLADAVNGVKGEGWHCKAEVMK